MRRYVQLRFDPDAPARLLSLLPLRDGRDPRLAGGVPYTGPEPVEATVSEPGPTRAFALTAFNVPLAVPALAHAIAAVAGADVQLVPVSVDGQPEVFALNSVRVVRCLDEARSQLDRWTPARHSGTPRRYWAVYNLVLDRSAIPADAHFFRIEDWTVALVISDEVRHAMESVGCDGAKLIELQQGP